MYCVLNASPPLCPYDAARRYDSAGNENADKCAWTFGNVQTSGAAAWNVQLGSLKFMLQQNWKYTGVCALS